MTLETGFALGALFGFSVPTLVLIAYAMWGG